MIKKLLVAAVIAAGAISVQRPMQAVDAYTFASIDVPSSRLTVAAGIDSLDASSATTRTARGRTAFFSAAAPGR
jgi:hypothetical protein